jgi:pimeloyl-ACP methyl ester carboxylesterase
MANFQTSDGLTLYFTDEGAGIPILCLSGLTRHSGDFSYITDKLPGTRLIKLDYRGRGRSDWAEDYTTYNILHEARDAVELLDHLGLAKAAVLGTSRGGLIAMALAATTPDRLQGVVFNDIGPEIDPQGLDAIMGFLGRNPSWKTYAEATAARATVMKGFANVPHARWRQEVEKLYHQTPQGLIINYDPRLRDAVIEAGAQPVPDLWPFYAALKDLPVAVIRGANSDLLSAETLEEMGRVIPDAILATVPDRGHIPFLDEPEALDALTKWIEQLK